MTESLEYVVRIRGGSEAAADVRRVEEAVKSTGGSMRTLGKESEVAGPKLAKATSGIKSVGKALIAAGAGFLAWEAGKKAFEFTDELVKSTKVLTAATGMSIAESSRWAGVTAAVGGNASQSAMAFQKVAAAGQKQVQATKEQIAAGKVANSTIIAGHAPLEQLGISTAFVEKHQKNLGPVMEAIVDHVQKLGTHSHLTSSVLTNLFGRGWKQLAPILLEGKKHLDDLLTTAKEMGVELKGGSANALEELREKQIRATLATEGLRLRFTELAAKPIGDLLQGFSALALAIEKNEWGKFDKEATKIGDSFTKIAEKILPHVAESFAHMAPAVLKGFEHGFTHASLGGQAVIAAVILTKIGLTKAILGTLAASTANLFLAPFGLRIRGGVVKAVEKSAAVDAAETAAFTEAGAEGGAAFSAGFAGAITGAAAIALGIGAYDVGKTLLPSGTNNDPFGGSPFPSKGLAPGEHHLSKKERAELSKEEAALEAKQEAGRRARAKAHPHEQERVIRDEEDKGWRPRRKGYRAREWPILPPPRGHGATAHDSVAVRDFHVYLDGRKVFQGNARQQMMAQAAGE